MSRPESKQRPRGRRKPIEHEEISHPHQHPQHQPHPQHHAPHHHAPQRHPSQYDDSSSEELQHHHIRQHRRQGSHPTRVRGRRVPAQAEEHSSTGEEDHIDPYQQHHIQHSHTYPVTDYYDAEGHLITSEAVYYEEGDGGEDGGVYEDGTYVESGVYDDGTYEDDISYDDPTINYPAPADLTDDTETRGTRLPRGENDDTSQTYNPDNLPLWVFLGGSCDPTTWRRDIAVPQLKQARIPFYNPQIDDWHPELIQNEARAKEECSMLLFVIDSKTRAIASMLEATEHIMRKRNVVLVILDVVEGTRIDGELVGARQLKDLNRARAFLCDIAARHQEHCDVFDQVQTAIAHIIDTYPGPPNKSTPSTPSHATTRTNETIPPLSSLSLQTDTPSSTQSGSTSQPSDSHRTHSPHISSPSLSPSPSPSDSSTTPLMTATHSTPVASPQPIHV